MIAVEDIAYVRVAAPDLDLMESFLVDFGMRRAARSESMLYMRGHGGDPVIHITEQGSVRHIGLALSLIHISHEPMQRFPPSMG